jgi:hypothetical protein
MRPIINMLAFWISPQREVLLVKSCHVATVISHPETFGLTLESITECYARHGEPLGMEGKARTEIILQLVELGWIRIRRYRTSGYSVNVAHRDFRTMQLLGEFTATLLTTGWFGWFENDRYMPVNLHGLSEGDTVSITLHDLATTGPSPLLFPDAGCRHKLIESIP